MIFRIGFRCLLLVLFSISAGCATSTEHTSLQYVPSLPKGLNDLKQVARLLVTDSRAEKSVLSYKRNLEGNLAGPILSNEPVFQVFHHAISQELLAHNIQLAEALPANQIEVDITHFYSFTRQGIFVSDSIGDLQMAVTVRSKVGNRIFFRVISTRAIEPAKIYMSADNVRRSLNAALDQGVKLLFSDLSFITAIKTRG